MIGWQWRPHMTGDGCRMKLVKSNCRNLEILQIFVKFMQSTYRLTWEMFYPQNAKHFERRWPTIVTDLTIVISSKVPTISIKCLPHMDEIKQDNNPSPHPLTVYPPLWKLFFQCCLNFDCSTHPQTYKLDYNCLDSYAYISSPLKSAKVFSLFRLMFPLAFHLW